jgi:hypothetical protein
MPISFKFPTKKKLNHSNFRTRPLDLLRVTEENRPANQKLPDAWSGQIFGRDSHASDLAGA